MGPRNNEKSLFQPFLGVCSFQAITARVCQRESLHQAIMRHINFLSTAESSVPRLYDRSNTVVRGAALDAALSEKSVANQPAVITAALKTTGKEGKRESA